MSQNENIYDESARQSVAQSSRGSDSLEKSKISKILSGRLWKIFIRTADLGPDMGNFYPNTDLGYPKPLFSRFFRFKMPIFRSPAPLEPYYVFHKHFIDKLH